jgi:hypothetical protein
MNSLYITATAVEKLKLSAKQHRDRTGISHAVSLEVAAKEAGYGNWKQVTEFAAMAPSRVTQLLEPKHRHCLTWVAPLSGNPFKVFTVSELCAALGDVKPYFIRRPCDQAKGNERCFCELDQFATAVQANVFLDVGDKHDFWNYMFFLGKPARSYPGWQMRVTLGLSTSSEYPNEHLATIGNDDRSNSFNPNNSAFKASIDNRSNQLNPNNERCGR